MTENEAIRDLQYLVGEYSAYPPETGVSTTIGSLQYCISALKEIQQYREIGTVEECREAVERQNPKKPKEILRHRGGFEMHRCPNCDTHYQTDNRYTIKDNYCPVCGKLLDSAFRNYCGNCGQAIDENLEGME